MRRSKPHNRTRETPYPEVSEEEQRVKRTRVLAPFAFSLLGAFSFYIYLFIT